MSVWNFYRAQKVNLDHSDRATERLIRHLRIDRAYAGNDWLVRLMDEMLSIKEASEKRPHDLKRLEATLKKAVDDARKEAGHPYFPPVADELERAVLILEAVETASKYVHAVTFDYDDYLNRFWSQLFSESYVAANLQTAARGVKIERIFVVPQAVLDGVDRMKHDRLRTLLKELRRAPANITLRVYPIEDLGELAAKSTTSFLTADDYFASESQGLKGGQPRERYVCYGDSQLVQTLEQRFKQLQLISRNW